MTSADKFSIMYVDGGELIMNKENKLGFAKNLFLVFLVLKLCKVIDWSWWWISAPLWVGVALLLIAEGLRELSEGFRDSWR